MKAGISKRELLEDYYIDEIGEVLSEYAKLLNPEEKDEKPEEVDGAGFFGF